MVDGYFESLRIFNNFVGEGFSKWKADIDLKDVAVFLILILQHTLLLVSTFVNSLDSYSSRICICVVIFICVSAFVVKKYSHHVWLLADLKSDSISQTRVLRDGEDDEDDPDHTDTDIDEMLRSKSWLVRFDPSE